MRSVLAVLKVAAVALVLLLVVGVGRRVIESGGSAVAAAGDDAQSLGGSVEIDSVRAAREAVLSHIGGPDSYLPIMLAGSDSILKRWTDHMTRPIRVYIAMGDVRGYNSSLREAARRAFVRWERVGAIPVRFQFVSDSAAAEVTVSWIRNFPIRRAGQADITWNRGGWIIKGHLTLATYTTNGLRLTEDAVHTVALHEIGHLLGLGHSDDPRDVMYPSTDVHDITQRDRHTARLLYAVPPGSVRLGG